MCKMVFVTDQGKMSFSSFLALKQKSRNTFPFSEVSNNVFKKFSFAHFRETVNNS